MFCAQDDTVAKRMGQQARAHVETNFSRAAFGSKLEAILLGLVGSKHAAVNEQKLQ